MLKKSHIAILLIGLGLILSAVTATVASPKTDKQPLEDQDSFPRPDEFIPVDEMLEMIYEEVPEYPEVAKKAGMEAIVWVKSLVNKKGEVVKAMIFKSSGSKIGFDEAALDAAYKCKYKPAIKDGKPVAIWVTYCVSFVMSKEKIEEKADDKDKEKDQNKEK